MLSKYVSSFLISLCFLFLWNCRTTQRVQNKLKTGDLIFVETNHHNLSGAISRVTRDKENEISYDHIGIVQKEGRDVYVLHASPKKGSAKEKIKSFISSHQDTRLVVYRLKDAYQSAIPQALQKANAMLGKPYNTLYILNDSSYYCSDYIERAFRANHIFELKPMTFIDPATGETDAYWATFYHKYHQAVPEGALGCNPNGLSKSNKIQRLFILNP